MTVKFASLEATLFTRVWWRCNVTTHGEMCVLFHMSVLLILYADSLVTIIHTLISPQMERKYSMEFIVHIHSIYNFLSKHCYYHHYYHNYSIAYLFGLAGFHACIKKQPLVSEIV